MTRIATSSEVLTPASGMLTRLEIYGTSINLPKVLLLVLVNLIWSSGTFAESFSPISPLTRFDAKGQLPQSDAAARAVSRGAPLIALSLGEAILLVAPSERQPLSLVEGGGLPKLWRLTKGICLSHVGLRQDSRTLLLAAQQAAADYENRFGEDIPVAEVVEIIAAKQQEATMQGRRRPYGSSILIAGLLEETPDPATKSNKQLFPRIYKTDPSGTFTLWKACAVGRGAETAMTVLEEKYEPDMDLRDALKLSLDCCRALLENGGVIGEEVNKGKEDKSEVERSQQGGSEETGAAREEKGDRARVGVDVALVSNEGVALWESISPMEEILELVNRRIPQEPFEGYIFTVTKLSILISKSEVIFVINHNGRHSDANAAVASSKEK